MAASQIEWTEMTWNPTTGCSKVSAGCAHCYAESMTRRLQSMGMEKYANGFKVECHSKDLSLPDTWKRPKMVFVNSMSDLFHEDIPLSFIQQVFDVMNRCRRHTFQVLTKRAERLGQLSPLLDWSPNIWAGVTVEDHNNIGRIKHLQKVPAAIRFLSLEPLLGPLSELDLTGISWVITGGESGLSARPVREEWICDIRNICISEGVPFFFKQWGGRNKRAAGKLLEGKTWCERPAVHP